MDASAACCGVGNDADGVEVDVKPSLGEEGGVGYIDDEMG
jgi:hypothetical protein